MFKDVAQSSSHASAPERAAERAPSAPVEEPVRPAPAIESSLSALTPPKSLPLATSAGQHLQIPPEKSEPLPLLSPRLFSEALSESTAMLAAPALRWLEKVGPSTATAAIAVTASATAALLYLYPTETLGAISTLGVIRSLNFEQNHHTRAQNFVAQTLFALHVATIGAWEAVIGSGVAAMRNLVQGMIPEERTWLRTAAGVAGYCAGAAVFASFIDIFPLLKISNFPLVAMTLATASETFTRRYSWATRVCYLMSTSCMVPYHMLVSGSWFGIGINLFNIPNLLQSIWRHDISKRRH